MRVEKHIINFDQSFCTGSNHYYLAENKIVVMDSPGSALVAILYIILLYYYIINACMAKPLHDSVMMMEGIGG